MQRVIEIIIIQKAEERVTFHENFEFFTIIKKTSCVWTGLTKP